MKSTMHEILSFGLIFMAALSSCKPKSNSDLKTLENFAFQAHLRSNVCSARAADRAPIRPLLAKIKIVGGSDQQQNLVRETLTSVPSVVLRFAAQARTIVHLVPKAKAACNDRVNNDLEMAPLYEETRSCMTFGFRGKTPQTSDGLAKAMPSLDIYVDADDGAIKHYLVRQFGAVTFGVYNHIQAAHGTDGDVGIRTPNDGVHPAINLGMEKVMFAYLADLKSLNMPLESLDAYLGVGAGAFLDTTMLSVHSPNDQPLMMLRSLENVFSVAFKDVKPADMVVRVAKFRTAVATEAFDSFYCNDWSPFDKNKLLKALKSDEQIRTVVAGLNKEKNTQGIMKVLFPRTYAAFDSTIGRFLKNKSGSKAALALAEPKGFGLLGGPSDKEVVAGRSNFENAIREAAGPNLVDLNQDATSIAMLMAGRSMGVRREAEGQAFINQYHDNRTQALWLRQAAQNRSLADVDRNELEVLQSTLSPIPVARQNNRFPGFGNGALQQNGLMRSASVNGIDPFSTKFGELPLGLQKAPKMYQIDLKSGKPVDPAMIAASLPLTLQGRARELAVRQQINGNLTEEERRESYILWEAAERKANLAAEGIVKVDDAWRTDLTNFKANYDPMIQKAAESHLALAKDPAVQDAFLRAKFDQYYEKTDPTLRDKLYEGKTADERFASFRAQNPNLLEGITDGVKTNRHKDEIKDLFVMPASSDPDQRVLLAQGKPTEYSRPFDWASRDVTTDATKRHSMFNGQRYLDPVSSQKKIDKEGSDLMGQAVDGMQHRMDISSAGLNGVALGSTATGVGAPVGAASATAAWGIDVVNAGVTGVRALGGSETQKAQLAGRMAGAIPGSGIIKSFDTAADTYKAVAGTRMVANGYNMYQLGRLPLAGHQIADYYRNKESYDALAKTQQEQAKISQRYDSLFSLPTDAQKNIDVGALNHGEIQTAGAVAVYAAGQKTRDIANTLVPNSYVNGFLSPDKQLGPESGYSPEDREMIGNRFKVPLLPDFSTDLPQFTGLKVQDPEYEAAKSSGAPQGGATGEALQAPSPQEAAPSAAEE